jgi:hypothetical protein
MFQHAARIAGVFCFLVSTIFAQDVTPPTITQVSPTPGTVNSLTNITVTFSEPVTGVDSEDFLIQGLAMGYVSASSPDGRTYTFSFPQPPYATIQIGWVIANAIADSAGNPFNATAAGSSWQYELVDNTPPVIGTRFPAPGATVRALQQIEVTFSEEVDGINASDLVVNGQPATSLTKLPGGPYIFGFTAAAPGTVNVSWAAGHGITDISPANNAFTGGPWSYTVNPNATRGDLVITEFLASNVATNGLLDEDRDNSDWIEIYNRGSNAVNLAGWSLSDDPEVPGFWVFGSRVLNPGQYMIVFASGKDRRNPATTNRFHTNFQLGTGGEHLGLYSSDSPRELVSGFEYPEQRNDHSYGYDPAGNVRYFKTLTPGAANGSSLISGVVEDVHFSAERGHYTTAFDLHLSTPTPQTTIKVTFDGSEPTDTRGFIYTNAIPITGNRVVRAAAFRPNMLPSRAVTHTYLFNQSAAIRSLPIISLVTATNNLIGPTGIIGMYAGKPCDQLPAAGQYHNPSLHGIAWERPVSAELLRLDGQPGFQIDCGIRVQGSDYQRPRTCATSKFSYRLYFRSDYGEGRLDYPFFTNTTVANFDQLVLRAGFNDPSNPFIRDEMIRRLSHEMGQAASHGNFVNLFVNGEYKGYYNPTERVHEEMLQAYHGGSSEWDVMSPRFATSSSGLGVVDGDRQNFNAFVNYVNTQPVTQQAIYQQVTQRLDVVNFVDYCLLNVYGGTGDWPDNNWRAGRERSTNGIWRFYVWDGEWAFGIYGRVVTRDTFAESGGGPDNSGLATPASEIANIYQRLRQNPEFRMVWSDRIHKHFFNNGVLQNQHLTNNFQHLRTQMQGVIPAMDTSILSAWVAARRGVIMPHFQNYGLLRSSNAPSFNQHGGRVPRNFRLTMTVSNPPNTVIYFTTNGVDPRVMFTSAVSLSARAWDPTNEFRLQQSMLVKARSLQHGTNWSALSEAQFDVGTLGVPIRITEINYNPPGGGGFEFIELQNVGAAPVDLSGMYFDGIEFTFLVGTVLQPGATLVLSSDADPNGFAARYPGVPVAGRFGGSLNNAGERITLYDRTGAIVFTVDYDDENGWPEAADGSGSSLEISDVYGDPDDPANWRASTVQFGTPNQLTPAPGVAAVRINEVMAENVTAVPNAGTYPDWVELYNAGGAAVDLEGWSITDDGNARKYIFGPGMTIPAGGYVVVWCDAITNTTPGIHTGFALGRTGETISLYNGATSRVDAVTFGLQAPDYTLGRIGADWSLNTPTPGAANAAATVGQATSVAINEWVSNPFPGAPDWIELHNLTNRPVSLEGSYVGVGALTHQITSRSFVPPYGFAQIFLDENVGADHVDLRLPSSGGTIIIYDEAASEVTRQTYAAQAEGVSHGRFPNGTGPVTSFVGSISPGASNYVSTYSGPYINEVMARNRAAYTNGLGEASDWIELYNSAATNVDLSGMSLSVGSAEPGEWTFPAGTVIGPAGFLVIACNDERAASTNAETYLNTGRNLDGESGGVYLFNNLGQLVNFVEYGHQIEDRSIGRVGAQWRLTASATPGVASSTQATLGVSSTLVFNEWMAGSPSGEDWFELFNNGTSPVELSGMFLTDDPSLAGIARFRIAPLSFIAPHGFALFHADEDPGAGRNHVIFSLSVEGESLRLYGATSNLITAAYFGAQRPGVSQGRLPDGSAQLTEFPGSASPAESNYLLSENVVINEVLTHVSPPLEQVIELYNPSDSQASIGGWYLSDDPRNFRKVRLTDGKIVPAGNFAMIDQIEFNNGSPNGFSLNRSRGGELWLSEADTGGSLTGVRVKATYGAALNGVSIGRHQTRMGVDFVALSTRTLDDFNSYPKVGPVVINEIMYHPPDNVTPTNVISNPDEEFLELYNSTNATVSLAGWKLRNGVDYSFPPAASLSPNGFLLVVGFNPVVDTAKLSAFRARYGVATTVPIFGPWEGQLNNSGERLELIQPDIPDGSYIPQVLVEAVEFRDAIPWPGPASDGAGASLQRRPTGGASTLNPIPYANDPLSWIAGNPSPGSVNNGPISALPVITQSPQSRTNPAGFPVTLTVAATGSGLTYQWRFQPTDESGAASSAGLSNLPGATNSSLFIPSLELEHDGFYDVIVSSPGGSVFSAVARLTVTAPPTILVAPADIEARGGSNVTLSVTAAGPGPLTYQWRFNGVDIAGATSRTLLLTNLQLEQTGQYQVFVSNPNATVSAYAQLTVLVSPIFLLQPQSVTAFVGDTVRFPVQTYGNTPMGYRWRRGGINYVPVGTTVLTITNVQLGDHGNFFDVIVTNRATAGTPGVLSQRAYLHVFADNDNDGVGDSWETANGLNPGASGDAMLDADGDGVNNLDEFIAGTNPTNALSYLRVDLSLAQGANVEFLALSNHNYTVQFRDDLGSGTWSNLSHVYTRVTNYFHRVSDPAAKPRRYYRLVTPYQP